MHFNAPSVYPKQWFDTKSAGTPVVILTGMGCSYEEWYEVIQSLRPAHRILSFHRHSWKEGDGIHRTGHAIKQLQTLLCESNVDEPILLIGHSYGGLIAQEFTKLFPERIKGLVLVDSTSVDLHELDAVSSDAAWQALCRDYATKTKEQLKRLLQPVLTDAQKRLPQTVQDALVDFQTEPDLYAMMDSEVEHWKTDAARIRTGPFPDVPLIVLARDPELSVQDGINDGLPEDELRQVEETWHRLVLRQATLTKHAVFIKTDAGHAIHLDRPDLVISAVAKLDVT